jgi:hypothetical protein
MWKANGKTTTLQLFLDSLSPKTERLSLEEAVDLSRDRLILELEEVSDNSLIKVYIGICLECPRKTQETLMKMDGVPDEIRNKSLQNTRLKSHRYVFLLISLQTVYNILVETPEGSGAVGVT